MASGLLVLLDDIATMLDDVAVMSKVAAKKTAGVVGDDLALNANSVTGVSASRELPVVWKIFLGAMLNKVILVPVALLISFFVPALIKPLLLIGGLFLCYEGVEKIMHKLSKQEHDKMLDNLSNPAVSMVDFEKDKIKGAVRTDFILSAEIIAIILGTVKDLSIGSQAAVLFTVSFAVTIFIYGMVAGIVKFDDLGFYLQKKKQEFLQKMGHGILWLAPKFMKMLSFVGTLAMFLVGGEIISHTFFTSDQIISWQMPVFFNFLFGPVLGLICGFLVFYSIEIIKKIKNSKK